MTKGTWHLPIGLLLIFLLLAPPLSAQQSSTDELRKEIQALSEAVKSMQKDLQEIKALLQGRAPAAQPENAVIDIGRSPSRGEPTAKLALIEFSDYQ